MDEKTEPGAWPPPPRQRWTEIILVALIILMLVYKFTRKEPVVPPPATARPTVVVAVTPLPAPTATLVPTPAPTFTPAPAPKKNEKKEKLGKKERKAKTLKSLESFRADFRRFTPSSLTRIREPLLEQWNQGGDREDLSIMLVQTLAYLGERNDNPADLKVARKIEEKARTKRNAGSFRKTLALLAWAEGQKPEVSNPDDALSRWLSAAVSIRAGRTAEGVEALREVVAKYPEFFPASEELATIYVDRSQYTDVEPILKRLLGMEPSDQRLEALYAETLEGEAKWAEIISRYEPMVAKDPKRYPLRLLLSKAYRRTGKFNDADRELNSLVAAQEAGTLRLPKKKEGQYFQERGKLAFDQGKYDRSLAHFQNAYDLDPSNASTLKFLAGAQFRLGRFKEAAQTYEKAVKSDPDDISTRLYHGMALFETGQDAKAEEVFQDVLKRGKETGTGYYYLARLRERKGNVPEAILMCERALKVDPANPNAKTLLAKLKPK